MYRFGYVCAVAFVAAGAGGETRALAAEPERVRFEITVEAGKHDREQAPVRVALDLPESIPNAPFVRLASGDDGLPAQLTAPRLNTDEAARGKRELHFLVPSLKAGEKLTLTATIPTPDIPESVKSTKLFQWSKPAASSGETTLSFDAPILKYVHPTLDETNAKTREATYKPFHHVYSPDGKRTVTKGPGGQFTHHRGLYFGFNRISYGDKLTCDVWHCKPPAYQEHEKVLAEEAGFIVGRHRVQIGWHGAKGEKFADEQRELSVYNAAEGQYIEFASLVRTTGGPIKLDGDPQHAGFHFRADNEVAEKTKGQTYYLRPDGNGKPGETRNWDAKSRNPKAANEPWKVMSFVLGGVRYSALYLDHPTNPKEARSSERDYGRFGTYFEYEITPEQPLRVNYRLILKEGEFIADDARRLSADFIDPPRVTVKKL